MKKQKRSLEVPATIDLVARSVAATVRLNPGKNSNIPPNVAAP